MGARGSGMPWVACGGMTLARHGMAGHALACPDANFWNVYKKIAVGRHQIEILSQIGVDLMSHMTRPL
jgi:hypothetical protein